MVVSAYENTYDLATQMKCYFDERVLEAAKVCVEAGELPLDEETAMTYDDALLEFVFLCDTRAGLEDEAVVGTDPELRWTAIARRAFLSAPDGSTMTDFVRSRLFGESRANEPMQREVYGVMQQELFMPGRKQGRRVTHDLEYAVLVARGAIELADVELTFADDHQTSA